MTRSLRFDPAKKLLLDPYLFAAFVISILAVVLAYQWRYPLSITVGGPVDGVLLYHVHDPEREKPNKTPYRWTTADSELFIRDWGAYSPFELGLDVARWRPNDRIADLTLFVNGLEYDEPQAAGQGRQEYRLPVADPSFLQSNNLSVKFVSDPFIPQQELPNNNDKRALGIQLYTIRLVPMQQDGGKWRPVDGLVYNPTSSPPLELALYFVGSALLIYLALVVFGLSRRLALGAIAIAAGAAGVGLVLARPYLTIFADDFFILTFFSVAAAIVVRRILPRLFRWGGIAPTGWELNMLSLTFGFAVLTKLAFLFYPQTISFDLLYHVHRLQFILDGILFWSIPSGKNEFGGQAVPYLPSFYLFLAPFAEFIRLDTLVRLSGVLLDSVTIFFIYFLLKKHFSDGRAGLFAAWIYVVTPLAFIALSWGIYANIFGQFLTLLLVVALVEWFDRLTTLRGFAVISLLFTLTMLSHTSVFASIVPLFAVWAALLFLFGRMWRHRPYWALIASILLAAGIAYLVYYSEFVGLVTQGASAIVDTAGSEETRNVGDQGLSVLQLLQPARTPFIAVPLYIYAATAAGLVGLIYRVRTNPDRGRFLLLTMLVAWFAALAALMFVRAEFGFSSRYVNFAMPALALCAGVAFSWAYAHRLIGRVAALGAAGLVAAQGAYHWYVLALYYYH